MIQHRAALKGNLKSVGTSLHFSKDKKLQVHTDFLLENAQIALGQDKKITGTIKANKAIINFADQKLTTAGRLAISQGDLVLPDNREFTGEPSIDLNITHTFDAGTLPLYSGSMVLENGTLKGLPRFDRIEQIKGKIDFANDMIRSD